MESTQLKCDFPAGTITATFWARYQLLRSPTTAIIKTAEYLYKLCWLGRWFLNQTFLQEDGGVLIDIDEIRKLLEDEGGAIMTFDENKLGARFK
jgi:hypothetical protein